MLYFRYAHSGHGERRSRKQQYQLASKTLEQGEEWPQGKEKEQATEAAEEGVQATAERREEGTRETDGVG